MLRAKHPLNFVWGPRAGIICLRVFEFKYSGFEARKTPSDIHAFQFIFLKVFEFNYNGFEARKTHSDPRAFQISIVFEGFLN